MTLRRVIEPKAIAGPRSWQIAGALLAPAAATLLCALGISEARAGTYVAANCAPGGDVQFAPNAQSLTNTSVYPRTTDCSGGLGFEGMRIRNSGGIGPSYAYGAWAWVAPPGASFSDVDFNLNIQNHAGHVASITLSSPEGSIAGRWTAATGFPQGEWRGAVVQPGYYGILTAWLECAGSCAPSSTAHTYVRNLYFTIEDVTPPQLTTFGGSAVTSDVLRGTETLLLAGADNQGGITAGHVKLNGVKVEERTTHCPGLQGHGPAKSFQPCPAAASWSIPINTELLPDGQNQLEACVEDLSINGAQLRTCRTKTIHVENSCPASGGVAAAAIDAGLVAPQGQVRPAVRVRSTRGSAVRGHLTGPGSVAGATVCLYEKVDLPGEGREVVSTGKVRNDGSFALPVVPGPSRQFDVVYRHNNKLLESKRLYLDSTVVPMLKVVGRRSLRNGQKVRFKGFIPGPNANGRAISMQARAGRKWRTFKQVRANAKGRFKAVYRFTQSSGDVRYIFRARVKRQGDYPFSPGSSRMRGVRVRGK